jgi:hypothetical protein
LLVSQEDDVVAGENLGSRRLQLQMTQASQVRLMRHQRIPRVRVRRDRRDLDIGVLGKKAKNLAARIARGAGNGDRIRHVFYLIAR